MPLKWDDPNFGTPPATVIKPNLISAAAPAIRAFATREGSNAPLVRW